MSQYVMCPVSRHACVSKTKTLHPADGKGKGKEGKNEGRARMRDTLLRET